MTEKRRGRPKGDDPADTIVRVRVTAGQRLELHRVAQANRTGMSGVIREAVNEYVSDYGERRIFRRHTK